MDNMIRLEQLHATLKTVFAVVPLKINGDGATLTLRKNKTQDDAKAIEAETREYLLLLLTNRPGLPEAVLNNDGTYSAAL